MFVSESPETIFSAIYCLCDDADKLVFYDNACNLVLYALGREPWFFKNMIALVDTMHSKGHVNCPGGNYL